MDKDVIIQLALETTGRSASLAILGGDQVLKCYHLDDRTRTAVTLAPGVNRALEDCKARGWEVSLISVAVGPGSFTGLRIGVTTAKTLAYAKKLPLVSVDSVAAVAAAAMTADERIRSLGVALDAYRGQAFVGKFWRTTLLPEIAAFSGDDLANRVAALADWSAHPSGVRVESGDSLDAFFTDDAEAVDWFVGDPKPLAGRVPANQCLDQSQRMATVPDAVGVGRLALRAWLLGQTVDPIALVPKYLRVSAAEEAAAEPARR